MNIEMIILKLQLIDESDKCPYPYFAHQCQDCYYQ